MRFNQLVEIVKGGRTTMRELTITEDVRTGEKSISMNDVCYGGESHLQMYLTKEECKQIVGALEK